MNDHTQKSLWPSLGSGAERARSQAAPKARSGHRPVMGGATVRVPEPGVVFGPEHRYELGPRLGQGGAGTVFLVRDRVLERDIAGKILCSGTPEEARAVLCQEARTLSRMEHPSIVRALGVESVGELPCLLMNCAATTTLQERLSEGALPPLLAIRLAIQLSEALRHAHQRGIVHLDVKPSNISVAPDGRLQLLDFGVGSYHVAVDAELPGPESVIVGTPLYMAPEQWALAQQDGRTDLWAVGMVLYEMLRGELPFGEHPSYLAMLQGGRYPRLSALVNLPPCVDEVIERLLQAEPEDRWSGAEQLLHALRLCHIELARLCSRSAATATQKVMAALTLVGPTLGAAWLEEVTGVTEAELAEALNFLLSQSVIVQEEGHYVVIDSEAPRATWAGLTQAVRDELMAKAAGAASSMDQDC